MNVSDLCEVWLRYKKRSIKKTSYIQYERMIEKYILEYIGKKDVTKLNITHVLEMVECLDQRLNDKTLQDVLVILKSILSFGKVSGYCDFPIAIIPSVKVKKKDVEVICHSDLILLENYLCRHLNQRNLGILICMYTGLRIGEICALHWDDVNLEERKITIHHTVSRVKNEYSSYLELSTPKTDLSMRVVPINQNLYNYLIQIENQNGYLLTGSNQFLDPRTYQYYFKKILNQLNLPKYKFHALRHTFASSCVQSEVDVKSLSEILGHHSVNITLNRYVHSSFDIKLKQIDKLSL